MIRERLAQWLSPRVRSIAVTLTRYGLFWSWNLVFLLLVTFTVAPYILWGLFLEVADGLLPPSLLVSALFVVAIPAIAALMAAWPLRQQSERWLPLMYGLEAPLLCLALFRLFALREVTPGAALLLAFLGLGILAYGYSFALGTESPTRAAAVVRTLGAGISMGTALYLAGVLAFHAIPTGVWLVVGFFRFHWLRELGEVIARTHGAALLWLPMALFTFFYAATLFVALPVALITLYARQGLAIVRSARRSLGLVPVVLLLLSPPLLAELSYQALSHQPQARAFDLLDPAGDANTTQRIRSDEDRRQLLSQKDEIRRGLLNAYLAPYRYMGATGSSNSIKYLWRDLCHLPEAPSAEVQRLYNLFVDPFLYHGQGLLTDQSRAEELYESFFDVPLQKAEREVIRKALAATYDRDQRQAGLINIGQRKVWLARQELTLKEQGDLASIELHEVYENQTVEQQEVFYYFSLPETAVLTGLWLGDTDDRTRRFAPNVAPRGAAQRVYTREVQRRADPALLEQVGPRQYRLRVFPVPPRSRWSRRLPQAAGDDPPPIMHLWLTYDTLAQSGRWPMPHLREQRNVYASSATVRSINGEPQSLSRVDAESWLPESLPARGEVVPRPHVMDFPAPATLANAAVPTAPTAKTAAPAPTLGGALRAQPVRKPQPASPAPVPAAVSNSTAAADVPAETPGPLTDTAFRVQLEPLPASYEPPALPPQQAFAVVLDRTLSMQARAGEVAASLAWLQKNIAPQHRVHLYLTSAVTRHEAPTRIDDIAGFDPATVQYFGGHRLGALLRQFAALRRDHSYRAVVVLTDDGSMDFADDKDAIADFSAPVFFVHLGGGLAAGYDDATLATMQRRGGSAVTSIKEAFARIAAAAAPRGPDNVKDALLQEVIDGYRITVTRLPAAATPPAEPNAGMAGGAALLARALILAQLREVDHGAPGALDRLHAVAKRYSQVSPYSSMLVLVNDAQRQALKQAEAEKDRFERQVENGKEQLTLPHDLMVSGVPEPEEWLLLVVVGIAVLFALRRS